MAPRALVVLSIGVAVTLFSLTATSSLGAEDAPSSDREGAASPEVKGEVHEEDPWRTTNKDLKWNEYEGKHFTFRGGFGLLLDTAAYQQDPSSSQQMPQSSAAIVRDFRLLAKGKLKFAPRLRYTIGYMYDGAVDAWRFRQTGIIVDAPELNGNVFIGRTKEGFSTNKLTTGYNLFTNERAAANEAFLPILADGIKFTANGLGGHLVYNVGVFGNLEPQQPYVKNDNQAAARAVWLPWIERESENVLHLALEGRYGAAKDGKLQFRSKPESYPAQSYAVDTGKIQASGHTMLGLEAYFRRGAWTLGTEYFFNQVASEETRNPLFHGGEIFAAYMLTGEVRDYNEPGAYFEKVTPSRSVFDGGWGALELVLRHSYVDLDSELVEGGTFWRLTPMLNWHLTDNVRAEFVYGYSELERLGLVGTTQYFQTRLQFQL